MRNESEQRLAGQKAGHILRHREDQHGQKAKQVRIYHIIRILSDGKEQIIDSYKGKKLQQFNYQDFLSHHRVLLTFFVAAAHKQPAAD